MKEKLPALTGLRFFAALAVVGVHFGAATVAPGPLQTLLLGGASGVSLFFVLSGFILVHSYTRDGRMRTTLQAFYRARMARIYPVYLLGLLIGLGPLSWQPSLLAQATPTHLLSSVFALEAWIPRWLHAWDGPTWSVSAEAFFYLVFPFALVRLLRLNRQHLYAVAIGCGALAVAIPLLYVAWHPQPADWWVDAFYANPICRVWEFGLGMALGRLYALRSVPPRWATWVGPVAIAAICACLLYGFGIPDHMIASSTLAPLFGLLLYSLAWGRGPLAALLATRPLVLLGEASYSLYILHMPLHDWLVHSMGLRSDTSLAGRLDFALYLALLVPLSVLVCWGIERPLRARYAKPRLVVLKHLDGENLTDGEGYGATVGGASYAR